MKKIYFLLTMFLVTGTLAKAQDTLLFEDFELATFYDDILIDCQVSGTPPPGTLGSIGDTNWYNMDADGLADASTGGTRPFGWFASQPVSTVDQYETVYGVPGTPDTNTVIAANSWTNDGLEQQNWLITKSVRLGLHDTLFWKSAPSQAPRYLDGYQILLSTTTNSDNTGAFSNVLFNAAEMINSPAPDPDTVFANFDFDQTGTGGPTEFIHGADGTYLDNAGTTAPISKRGRLRPFSLPLDAFANQYVYIAFYANTHDDNLITLDDIMIRGTLYNSINENANNLDLNLFPNPATDKVQVNYTLTSETTVSISISDVTGKLISTVSEGKKAAGRQFANINTAELAKGFYTLTVVTTEGQSTSKLIVR